MLPIRETGQQEPSTLTEFLSVLSRRKIWVIVSVLVAVAGTLLLAARAVPQYESSTRILLRQDSDAGSAVPPERFMSNELEMLQSARVSTRAHGIYPDAVGIDARAEDDADVLEITARSADADQASKTANAYAAAFVKERVTRLNADAKATIDQLAGELSLVEGKLKSIQQGVDALDLQIAGQPPGPDRDVLVERRQAVVTANTRDRESLLAQQSEYQAQLASVEIARRRSEQTGAQVLEKASPASEPIGPRLAQDLILAVVAGLVVGIVLAGVRDYLDVSLRTEEDLRRVDPSLPMLASIPRFPKSASKLPAIDPVSVAAESYRMLRTSVQFYKVAHSAQVFQITSPFADEGKSVTVANLGLLMAKAGERVLVVGADLRRPSLHALLDVQSAPGLRDVLLHDAMLADCIVESPLQPGLSVLAAGTPMASAAELLSLPGIDQLFDRLRASFSCILIDSPPVLPVTDALLVSQFSDAVILVTRAGRTSRRDLQRTLSAVRQGRAPVAGFVLNWAEGELNAYGYDIADFPAPA